MDKQITLVIKGKSTNVGIVKGYEVQNFLGQSFGVFHGFTRVEVQDIIETSIETDFDRSSGTNYKIVPVKIFIKLKG